MGLAVFKPLWELTCQEHQKGWFGDDIHEGRCFLHARPAAQTGPGNNAASPDLCLFPCVHQTMTQEHSTLLGTSPLCSYLGLFQILVSYPPSEAETTFKSPSGRGLLEEGSALRTEQPWVTLMRVFLTVHSQLWGRRADQVRAVPGRGPASRGLLHSAEARSLPGLQHSLLPHRREAR